MDADLLPPESTKDAPWRSMQRLVVHLDLFSGIGGFALAAQMAGGIKTVGFCEINPYAQKVLAKNFPEIPIHGDIKTLDPNQYGTVELITGGFPCQPYSLAGKRGGNEDDRALWPQMLRVIREARPRWVLGENVPGIITMALDGVLTDLEKEGYTCETLCVPACGVDAQHRRERVWIVAHSNSGRREQRQPETKSICRVGGTGQRLVVADPTSGNDGESNARKNQRQEQQSGKSGSGQDVANTNSQRGRCGTTRQQDASNAWKSPCHWKDEDKWFAESGMGRVANGIPNRVDRLKGLGNAIVPQVAAEILRCMMRVDSLHNTEL